MASFRPAYLRLLAEGGFAQRVEEARERLRRCAVCPRNCGVNRLEGELGECRTGALAQVGSVHAHHGEEPPLVGTGGSGTIFFSYCNLHCQFCQNFELSAFGEGEEVSPGLLANSMLALQERGCHNINFVSPSHVVPQILEAVHAAAQRGLRIPLVYNTGGYDLVDTLRLLEGVVDIYMPDMKYADDRVAERYSKAPEYTRHNRAAVREMHRQVGDFVVDSDGIAQRGLIVRHLVLPGGLAGSEAVARFLAGEVSRDTYVNVMDQYRPCLRVWSEPPLDRRITPQEYAEALSTFREAGIHRFAD